MPIKHEYLRELVNKLCDERIDIINRMLRTHPWPHRCCETIIIPAAEIYTAQGSKGEVKHFHIEVV